MVDISTLQEIDYSILTNEQKEQFGIIKCLPNCQTLVCCGNHLTVLPELPNCQELNCNGDSQLYYSRQFANRFELTYPSPDHCRYFKEKWKKIIDKVTMVRILTKETSMDEYVLAQIICHI